MWLDVEALVTHPVAIIAWRGPTSHAPEGRALTVAARLLTGPHGALGPAFLNDDTGALRITVHKMSSVAGVVLAVGVVPREGFSLAKLLPAVHSTIATLPDCVTEGDVADARKRLSDEQLLNLETSMGRASRLADPHGKASWGLDEYDSVDRASVVDAMRRFLAPEQRVTMVVRPATRPLLGVSAVLLHRDRMAR